MSSGHFVLARNCSKSSKSAMSVQGLTRVVTIFCCLALSACGSPGPFYHQHVKELAFRPDERATRSAKVATLHLTVASTTGTVHTQGAKRVKGISSEDRAFAEDIPAGHVKIPSREFGSTPFPGSPQYLREKAEDQVREKELSRTLRICAC